MFLFVDRGGGACIASPWGHPMSRDLSPRMKGCIQPNATCTRIPRPCTSPAVVLVRVSLICSLGLAPAPPLVSLSSMSSPPSSSPLDMEVALERRSRQRNEMHHARFQIVVARPTPRARACLGVSSRSMSRIHGAVVSGQRDGLICLSEANGAVHPDVHARRGPADARYKQSAGCLRLRGRQRSLCVCVGRPALLRCVAPAPLGRGCGASWATLGRHSGVARATLGRRSPGRPSAAARPPFSRRPCDARAPP